MGTRACVIFVGMHEISMSFHPGLNTRFDDRTASADKSAVDSLLNIGRNLIPTNIVAAAAVPNFLGVIMFAIVFAAALNSIGAFPIPAC